MDALLFELEITLKVVERERRRSMQHIIQTGEDYAFMIELKNRYYELVEKIKRHLSKECERVFG